MPRVLTNETALSVAVESALNTPSSDWRAVEVNTPGAFGAAIETRARQPISRNRQRRKGSIVNLTSPVEFELDLTMSAFRDFIEPFIFARAVNHQMTEVRPSAVAAAGYAVTAAQFSKALLAGHLIQASGFGNAGNNGLRALTGAMASDATRVPVSSSTAETSPANARISLAGFRIPGAAAITWGYSGATKRASLGLPATIDGTKLHLTPGQVIHIGSYNNGSLQHGLLDGTAMKGGFARVRSTAAGAILLDRLDNALQNNDLDDPGSTASDMVDIMFGTFVRNVGTSDSSYLRRSLHFEAAYPTLTGSGNGAFGYEYARGNYGNTMALNLPLGELATMSLAFVGTDAVAPSATRHTTVAAGGPALPLRTVAFNTAADSARLRVTDADEDGLSTDFKSLTLNINNNVSPERTVGRLGAAYVNVGNLEINIEAQLIFSSADVIDRIRNNATVSLDFILRNDDGAIAVDIPAATLSGGARSFPVNESVLVDLTCEPFADPTFNTSVGISMFPSKLS